MVKSCVPARHATEITLTNLTPVAEFDDVPQLEKTTQALAGPGGPMNAQAQALLNRTEFLNQILQGNNPQFTAAMVAWFQSLPTSPPAALGEFWNNDGTLAFTQAS
ncbi:hypothetical protein JXVLWARM_CDS_0098 [Burkholderia phage Bm1]